MGKSLELIVWLSIAGLALCSVQILLWRARRVIAQSRQVALAQEVGLVPAAHLVPNSMMQPAISDLAS